MNNSIIYNARTGQEKYSGSKADEVKNIAIWSLVGLTVLAGGFIGVRYLVRDAKQNSAANDSLNPGAAANYASRLKMAFDNDNSWGWGTDEDLIFQVMKEIPSRAFYNDVIKAYSSLYKGANLNTDLQDELDSSEYNEVMKILNSKP